MPRPVKKESQKDFISRFMSSEEAKADYPDEKQRYAVAMSMWRRRDKVKKSLFSSIRLVFKAKRVGKEGLVKKTITNKAGKKQTVYVKAGGEKLAKKTISKLREIVSGSQAMKVQGTMIDLQTASVITQVYDKLSDEYKKTFMVLPIGKMVNVAWKVYAKATGGKK